MHLRLMIKLSEIFDDDDWLRRTVDRLVGILFPFSHSRSIASTFAINNLYGVTSAKSCTKPLYCNVCYKNWQFPASHCVFSSFQANITIFLQM